MLIIWRIFCGRITIIEKYIEDKRMTNRWAKRVVASFIGVMLISTAVAIFRYCNLGTDPFTCFNMGIVNKTGLSFGDVQVIANVILIAGLFLIERSYFGIGTIMSMFLIGYVSDYLLTLVPVEAATLPMFVRYPILVIGIFTTSFGIALYSCAKLGISGYDAMSFILVDRLSGKLHLQYVRIIVDLLLIIGGFIMGSVVGVGTIMIALGVGPCVVFLLKKIIIPYIFPENKSE